MPVMRSFLGIRMIDAVAHPVLVCRSGFDVAVTPSLVNYRSESSNNILFGRLSNDNERTRRDAAYCVF